MGLTSDGGRIRRKLHKILNDLPADLVDAAAAAGPAIVQTTLAGIGAGDQPFAPYAASTQATLDLVGGKPNGVVDLRGIFYHSGQAQRRFRSQERRVAAGADRRAYHDVTIGDRTFTARTPATRPQLGIEDPYSEMSADLIHAEATSGGGAKLVYEPRAEGYMILHNDGTGKAPQREWFSLNKAAVRAAVMTKLTVNLRARVAWFNGLDPADGPDPTP